MSARDEIFASVRRSLGVTGKELPRQEAVRERIAKAPRGIVPARGQLSGEALLALFEEQALATLATIERVPSRDKVPDAIADYLRRSNLPARLRMGADERLAQMPWSKTALEISHGKSEGGDLIAVNHAFAGVAETGTLVITSRPDNPSTLNFLPAHALVGAAAQEVRGAYEDVWQRLRERDGKGHMPRTVNWITGPSRSGDIEQKLLLGAHGPRSVHVVLVEG